MMDTSALMGPSPIEASTTMPAYYQRLSAEDLHGRLRHLYFEQLTLTITNRAEMVGLERRLTKFSNMYTGLTLELRMKIKGLAECWALLRKEDLLRLRRSVLGQRMFGKSQNKLLRKALTGWVRWFWWHRGIRNAFELNWELLKRELEVTKLFSQSREAKDRQANIMAKSQVDPEGKLKPVDMNTLARPGAKKSLHQRHTMRAIQCRHCHQFYVEAQNTDMSCAYHPGEYKTACPAACPGLTTNCMRHRKKRWSCCDVQVLFLPVDLCLPVYLSTLALLTALCSLLKYPTCLPLP